MRWGVAASTTDQLHALNRRPRAKSRSLAWRIAGSKRRQATALGTCRVPDRGAPTTESPPMNRAIPPDPSHPPSLSTRSVRPRVASSALPATDRCSTCEAADRAALYRARLRVRRRALGGGADVRLAANFRRQLARLDQAVSRSAAHSHLGQSTVAALSQSCSSTIYYSTGRSGIACGYFNGRVFRSRRRAESATASRFNDTSEKSAVNSGPSRRSRQPTHRNPRDGPSAGAQRASVAIYSSQL
jgi:hypothetical protein